VLGTIPYLSPEQACGSADIDCRSDQFSFGIGLYELAAGKNPFERSSVAVAWVLSYRWNGTAVRTLIQRGIVGMPVTPRGLFLAVRGGRVQAPGSPNGPSDAKQLVTTSRSMKPSTAIGTAHDLLVLRDMHLNLLALHIVSKMLTVL